MAIYTTPNLDEILPGSGVTPRWFITRYKRDMNNLAALPAELGTAADHGFDPAIASIPETTESTATICNFPTHQTWSAAQSAILFYFKIDGNTAGNLTVDVSWYEACYGTTGAVERWRLIATDYGISDLDPRQIGSDGGRIFCHIDAIHNPDGDASLTVYARAASAVQIVGAGGGEPGGTIIDEGVEAVGVKVWDSTLVPPRWVKCDITAILAALDDLDDVIEDHDAVLAHPDTLKVGGMARTTLVGAAVAAGDVCRITTSVNGGQLAAGYDAANATTMDLPIVTGDSAAGAIGLPVMARSDTTLPAAVGDGDAVAPWATPNGAIVAGGFDAANNTPRNLPLDTSDSAISAHGLPIMARADTTLPAAVGDGDAVNIWASPLGSPVVSGFDAANVLPRPIPVEAPGATIQGSGVVVAGRAESTIPTAVDDGDVVYAWHNLEGAAVVAGYDVNGTTARPIPVNTDNETASTTGIPIGGRVDTTVPAAHADGEFAQAWASQEGALVVAGYDTANTIARPIPIGTSDTTATAFGVSISLAAEETIPAAVHDGDSVRTWATLNGALVVAGYDTANTVGRPIPIGTHGDNAPLFGVHVNGLGEATIPAAVLDGESVQEWNTLTGARVVAGYDASAAATSRTIPVEVTDGVSQNTGIPVGAKAWAGIPTAVADLDFTLLATDLAASLKTHLTQGLDYTTSSVASREVPATGGGNGSTAISNAANTYLNAGASIACISVMVRNNGTGWIRSGIGVQTATTGVPLDPGDVAVFYVDDVAKIGNWAQNLNDPIGWSYASR